MVSLPKIVLVKNGCSLTLFSHIFVCGYNLLFFGLCNIAKKEEKLNLVKQKLGLNDEEMDDWKGRYIFILINLEKKKVHFNKF